MLTACSTIPIDENSAPEAQFQEGERLFKKGRYLEATERFRILRNRHPYSNYASLATLRIGDVYFEQESFIEAASAYKIFLELYPKHPKADYAVFRMGESNYRQVPGSIDRDLDAAQSGITTFERLQKEYPNSQYQIQTKKMLKELREKLAAREEYVGDFYFKREFYAAASGRYRQILKDFSDTERNEKSLYRLTYSYEKMGEKEKALETLERLQLEFPKSQYQEEIKTLERKLQTQPPPTP